MFLCPFLPPPASRPLPLTSTPGAHRRAAPRPPPPFHSQLGIGSTEHSPATVVAGLPAISGVSGGEKHRCAHPLRTPPPRATPTQAAGRAEPAKTASPLAPSAPQPLALRHIQPRPHARRPPTPSSCFLSTTGDVWCAGNNEQFQLGQSLLANNLPPPAVATRPVKVANISDALTVAAARNFTCASIKATRSVKCWGGARAGRGGEGGPVRAPPTCVWGVLQGRSLDSSQGSRSVPAQKAH
jgi:hypothetical protein